VGETKNKSGFQSVKIGDLIIDNGMVLIVLRARQGGNWTLYNALSGSDWYLLNRSVYSSEDVKHIPI